MKISFILNGEDIELDLSHELPLSSILRDQLMLKGTKDLCKNGHCGLCSILLDGQLVASCMIPAFKVRGKEVITIEGFRETEDFKDIYQGFLKSATIPCPHCATSRVFTIHNLLEKDMRPSRELIIHHLSHIHCGCMAPETLIRVVRSAGAFRERRINGRN
ncbi:(2Fe-2S)-binding protein [Spirochaeta cellobiosiphila]|uniref:(2Fe-2S)-binding protein n=1 Tax=Spirochaeta cellobiosiphila TaxID=504483 RepID=UPI00042958F4|nr:xanthine dehydrogenase subunit XdhC [Spirochaeta cellobiosiphila]